jgi:hypothetical protein
MWRSIYINYSILQSQLDALILNESFPMVGKAQDVLQFLIKYG